MNWNFKPLKNCTAVSIQKIQKISFRKVLLDFSVKSNLSKIKNNLSSYPKLILFYVSKRGKCLQIKHNILSKRKKNLESFDTFKFLTLLAVATVYQDGINLNASEEATTTKARLSSLFCALPLAKACGLIQHMFKSLL